MAESRWPVVMTANCHTARECIAAGADYLLFAGMGDLFDAAAMYDEDYLYFFAAPGDPSEFAVHGPVVPGACSPG